jgi:hypothetical protein
LLDKPEVLTKPVDDLYNIVKEEFDKIDPKIKEGLILSKSYNSTAVEINYENTWKSGEMGFPIFSIEDMYSGTNILQSGMAQMGVIPTIAYDANIYISPGLGTADDNGQLIPERMRLCVQALVKLMEIVGKYSGFIE